MRKHGLKILGLALMAAIGLMAFSASSALAVDLNLGDAPFSSGSAGQFLKDKGTLWPTGLNDETVGGEALLGTLLIPGKSAEIHCEKGLIQNGVVLNEFEDWKTPGMRVGGHGHGTILFLGCKVFKINPTTFALEGELTKCTEELNKATSLGVPLNHHITAEVLLLVRKHENVNYIIAEPLIASKAKAEEAEALTLPFATLKFGGTCSLPETVKVTGCVAAQAPADSVSQLLSIDTALNPTLQKLLGCKLKFGANEAFIKGEVHLELTGAGAGHSWGATL